MYSDELWKDWMDLQRQCFKLADKKMFLRAIDKLNEFLERQHDPELKSEVIGLRGEVFERMGELRRAKEDFVIARDLSEPASYLRYTLELNIAATCEKLHDGGEASSWYIKALETVAGDPLTSGATAIRGFLNNKAGVPLNAFEIDLCNQVINQAWRLFSLPGEPDLSDVKATLELLDKASIHPLPIAQKS
jgi:hypothetical protein